MSDNELDNLFKEAADGFRPPNDPAAWQDMARKLDQVSAATTASFWNWKTISSTVVVGVAIVASVLYLTMSDSNPEGGFGSQPETSADAVVTPIENETSDDKTPESNTVPGTNTPSTAKQSALADKENNKRNTEERVAGRAEVSTNSQVEKSNVPRTENVTASQTQVSQTLQSAKPSDNKSAEAPTKNSETRKEIKKDGTTSASILSGVAVIGKAIEPATSGPTNAKERSSSEAVTTAQNSQPLVGKENTTQGTGATPEKVTEPTSSSAGSNQSSTRATDSSNQLLPDDVSSMKKSDGGKPGTAATVATTEKAAESASANAVVQSERVSANRSASNAQELEGQAVAGDSLQEKSELKQEAVARESADEVEPEPKEERSAFNRFAVKLAVAPDYSTVERATPNSLGINYGVLFEYRITKHWSVATGGIWSKKIYSAYDVEYSGYNADWVDGDCRMWDIPINVYYNFSSRKPFSFYASLGLSSYLMNEENYVYYVETPYGTYDYPRQVKGENNEWFKTLNVSVGMQFRMSQQFSLQFEPTLKAPLAGVGEGEVSLVSLGAFFNLRYEIPVNKLRRNDD